MPQLELIFIAFCAAVVTAYWFLPERWRNLFLAISSSIFLLYVDAISFTVLVSLTALLYYYGQHSNSGRLYLLCLILVLLLFCGIRIVQLLNRSHFAVPYIILIGFGFYALKFIHYAVESRNRTFRPHSFLEFYNYILFFPTITIGPIHFFEDFQKSGRRVRWNEIQFASGLERILYGYAKVIVVANWLVAVQFDGVAATLESGSLRVLADSMVYGFYLYFSFAGYSDIAIGLALLVGYQINENFNYPFLKRNIGEFWQSWHMSLSFWCRKYVFLPVYAASRILPFALIGTMLAIALWHEFSARFFLWGVYHGLGLLIWRKYQNFASERLPGFKRRIGIVFSHTISVLLTFLFVMVSFTIPRSESLQEILRNFQLLLGLAP
jgi:alginate O-acetyltransferase complex protein AlgI